MTILEIRTALNSRLSKSVDEDALNADVQRAVEHISKIARWPDMHKEGTALAFAVTNKSKALPTGHRGDSADDGAVIDGYRPLVKASWDDIRNAQEQQSPTSGRPLWYCIRGKAMYVYPIPEATHSVVPLYYQIHPSISIEETTAILFSDEFTEAVITQTIVEYLKSNSMTTHPKLMENARLFATEIGALLPDAETKVVVTKPFNYGVN